MSMNPNLCLHVMSPCLVVSISLCFYVSCLCLHVWYSHVSMSLCLCPCFHVSGIPHTELRNKGKTETSVVCCKRKTVTANFRLFPANGQRKFVFFGRQNDKRNQRLLFQGTCPSMPMGNLRATEFLYNLFGLSNDSPFSSSQSHKSQLYWYNR
jgi:hypothetical protein